MAATMRDRGVSLLGLSIVLAAAFSSVSNRARRRKSYVQPLGHDVGTPMARRTSAPMEPITSAAVGSGLGRRMR